MNILTIGKKIDAIKKEAGEEIPKITAFEHKAEAALKPIFDAILEELKLKGTVTPEMIANVEALVPEGKALIAEFGHFIGHVEEELK